MVLLNLNIFLLRKSGNRQIIDDWMGLKCPYLQKKAKQNKKLETHYNIYIQLFVIFWSRYKAKFSKAFDKVFCDILIRKVVKCGIKLILSV